METFILDITVEKLKIFPEYKKVVLNPEDRKAQGGPKYPSGILDDYTQLAYSPFH
jgi:hypothetical protein